MAKIAALKNPIVKNIVSAVAVAGFGFVLLNIASLFDFLFQRLIDGILKLFTKVNFTMEWQWFL
jgi:hypothetical protein